jgi:hypothetical protein
MSNKPFIIRSLLFLGILLILNFSLSIALTPLDRELFEAIQKNDTVKIRESLQKGANINAQTSSTKETPLITAVHKAAIGPNSYIEPIVELLINTDAQTNIQDKRGNTALHYAIRYGRTGLIKQLIDHGADPLIKNVAKESALDLILPGLIDKGETGLNLIFSDLTEKKDKLNSDNIDVAKMLIDASFKSFSDTKKPYQEADSFYKIVSLFMNRYKGLFTAQEMKKLNLQMKKLSNSYKLVTSASQLKKYPIDDLLKIFEVSAVEDTVLNNPQDALPVTPANKSNKTQTESYLSIPVLRESVIKVYRNALTKYPKLIQRIMNQERKFNKDYDVFYHGQKRDFIIFYDVIKEIQNWFNQVPNTPEFEYIRFPEGQNRKLSEYIVLGELINDHDPKIGATLLPVNVSLFGNSSGLLEASFYYFLRSDSVNPPANLLTTMFTQLGLNTKYIPEILDLLNLIESQTGNLLQIFIPRGKVNEYVYPCVDFGKPLNTKHAEHVTEFPIRIACPTAAWYNIFNKYTAHDLKTIDMATYLNFYRNHPEAINPQALDKIQARINITEDFLLNSKSGVKIFRYTTVHPDKLLEYQQKLRIIIKEVMEDWRNRNTTPANR